MKFKIIFVLSKNFIGFVFLKNTTTILGYRPPMIDWQRPPSFNRHRVTMGADGSISAFVVAPNTRTWRWIRVLFIPRTFLMRPIFFWRCPQYHRHNSDTCIELTNTLDLNLASIPANPVGFRTNALSAPSTCLGTIFLIPLYRPYRLAPLYLRLTVGQLTRSVNSRKLSLH